jgi:hypothetical protein
MTELLKRKRSNWRHNISELARELGITALSCISGVKSTFGQGSFPGNGKLKANSWTGTNSRAWKETQGCRIRTWYIKSNWHLFKKRSMIYVFIKNNEKIFRLKRCAKFSTLVKGVIINGKANLFLIGNKELCLLKKK